MPSSRAQWIDPAGTTRKYTNTAGGLRGGASRALERERTWSAIDPSYDSASQGIQNGQVVQDGSIPWWLPVATLGGPLAGAFLPAAFGAGGAAGTGAATGTAAGTGAAAGAGASAAASGLGGALKGLFTDPNNLMGIAGVIAALAGGRGGNANTANAERLNQITEQRMRRTDPLHQAITQLAWNRLPTNARQGIAPPTYSPLG